MAAFYRKWRTSRNLWQGRTRIPRLWLFTDERVADDILFAAIARLPRGSGIVFRHYATESSARAALFRRVRQLARRRGAMVFLGGENGNCRAHWRANGRHLSGRYVARSDGACRDGGRGPLSVSVHNEREMVAANRIGADIIFVSPVFPSNSHPGGQALGRDGFARLARLSPVPVIALGGMTSARFTCLRAMGAHGWAAIDALLPA